MMKKDYKIFLSSRIVLVFLFLLGIVGVCEAQTFEDDEEITTEIELEDEIVEGNIGVIFDVLGLDTSPNFLTQSLVGSNVFLQQIGDLNNVNVAVQANSSDISVVQIGNQNNTSLDYQVRTVITDVIQNGDGNVLSDFVLNPLQDISLEVQQKGNYLTFERFGSNDLTKSLRFIQTEASPSIIVRSFN